MPIVLSWFRIELRRRWRALLVLAVLIALSAGTVLGALAGARRTDTALDRLLADTLPATALVNQNEPGFDWQAVRALPSVEALTTVAAATVYKIDGIGDEFAAGLPMDSAGMRDLERPVVLTGRLTDPTRADEAVVTPAFVQKNGRGVGDTVTLRLYDGATVDTAVTSGALPAPDGPVIQTRIVGVVRSFWLRDDASDTGQLQPSAALLEQHKPSLLGNSGLVPLSAMVRLTRGGADLPAFTADLTRLTGRTDFDLIDLSAKAARIQQTTRFEAANLLAFGLAALAAAVVLIGQALARYATGAAAELRVLQATGLRRREALAAATAGPVVAALAGTAVGVGLAIAASRWFPFGTAAPLEPAPGLSADPLVLGLGAPLLVLLIAGGTAAAAWFALRARDAETPRRSAVAAGAARVGLPVPVAVGARFALEPGHGRSALPVRPAMLGVVTGVLGVLAAFTVSAGVADAAENPVRFGQTHQLELTMGYSGTEYGPPAAALGAALADPDVVAAIDTHIATIRAGANPLTVLSYAPVGSGTVPTVLAQGRMPAADNEIVLAGASAATLGAKVDDTLPATGSGGGATLTVTGIGFVPHSGTTNYDEGAWLSPAGYDRLVNGFNFHVGLIALRSGADPAAVLPRLATAIAAQSGGDPSEVQLALPQPVVEIAQLRNVEALPRLLAGFVALLAVGAMGYALATAVRRRGHDVAVLRALGMTRWQSREIVLTQACVLAVIGLAFGIPLGLALGRVLWRVIADATPLLYVPPQAGTALALIAPLVIGVAVLLAVAPGQRAARLRVGQILRAE